MKFIPMEVEGAWVIDPEPKIDERGFFARIWDKDEFNARGLSMEFIQCNNSASSRKGTLRGLHWQMHPYDEIKVVRCIHGAIFDIIADVRGYSPTFGKYSAVELTKENRRWVYVPAGCAHGYLALEDNSEVLYAVTSRYVPSAEKGIRWNDPRFNIMWPDVGDIYVSEKDRSWPDFGSSR